MMTRKDFQNVANAINDANRFLSKNESAIVRMAFHDMLQAQYPRFDALKFWEALDYPDKTTG